jgi:hypothetical protein
MRLSALRAGHPSPPERFLVHTLLHSIVLLTYLLTELSPSWEATNCTAPQELPSILWNPKVQCRVHKSPPLVPIVSHIHPIHSIPSYLSKIHFNIVGDRVTQLYTQATGSLSSLCTNHRAMLEVFYPTSTWGSNDDKVFLFLHNKSIIVHVIFFWEKRIWTANEPRWWQQALVTETEGAMESRK